MSNSLEIPCPKCNRKLRVRTEFTGDPIVCIHCEHMFHAKMTLHCPECSRSLQVRREYLGKRIFCSYCKHTFRAEPSEHPLPSSTPEWATPGPITAVEDHTRMSSLETELLQMRSELARRTARHLADSQALEQTQGTLQELQRQVLVLQRSLDQGRVEQQNTDSARHEVAQAERDNLRAQLHAAQERMAGLERRVQDEQALQAEITRLRHELEIVRHPPVAPPAAPAAPERELLRQERDRLAVAVEELRSRLQGLETERAASTVATAQFQWRIRELETALASERATAIQHVAKLTQDCDLLRGERDRFQAEQQAAVEEREQLRTRMVELETSLTQAATHEEGPDSLGHALQEARAQVEAERQALHHEAEQWRTRVGELEQALAAARTEQTEQIHHLTSAHEALSQERDQLAARAETLAAEAEGLRQQLIEYESVLPEPVVTLEDEQQAVQQALDAARAQWLREREELQGQWRRQQQAAVQAAEERLNQELASVQRERESTLQQVEALAQERAQLAQTCEELRAALEAAEQQRTIEADEIEVAAAELSPPGAPLPDDTTLAYAQRYLQLAEQIQALKAELDEREVGTASAAAGVGRLARSFGLSRKAARAEEIRAELTLRRRLDSIRDEALAERERALVRRADEERAVLDRELAELRAQLREAKERADRLELDATQQPNLYAPPERFPARFDTAHDIPYSGPSSSSNSAASGQWRMDELT